VSLVTEAPAPAKATQATTAWKTVLVHVEPGKAAQPRLETAVSLARKCDALLIGLGAELVEPVTFADPYGSWDAQVLTAMREQVQENLVHADQAFVKHAAGIRSEWRQVEDRPAPAMARVARGADVIVAGGCPLAAVDGYRAADPAELALLSGRPVLVTPPQGGALKARSVVIAWKETRESRRAIADALPLLVQADKVLVVEICDEAEGVGDAEFHASEVAEGLKRHGVAASGKAVRASDDKVVSVLNAEAKAIGADLIVAGCYGHSRMNEWFFGGVTRDLLSNPERFILMSH
jgi:nucleotide-binding universal stress UspA family protein